MKNKIILKLLLGLTVLAIIGAIILRSSNTFYYSGTIEATRIEVPARVASIIRSKAVQEGQRIKEGQVLYSLAGEDIRLAAEIAEKDFARAARLFRLGSIPQENYEHLRAKRDDASLKLKWCNIEAPSSGTVLNLYREPGEWAGPGMRMAAIADLTEVWATFYVEQTRLASLQLGQKVQAILPEVRGRFFEGTITRIAEVAEFTPKNIQTREERARLVYAIKINFKNEDGMLKPGMSFEARL